MKMHSSFARLTLTVGLLGIGLLACVFNLESERPDIDPQRWWEGRGPVVPHGDFPSDCQLCHQGNTWESIRDDFAFDHLAETGVALEGAHERAECLRCHNDRGPVGMFSAQGCSGCHEDIHRNQLGSNCQDCHDSRTWEPEGQIAMHSATRFPLIGAHAATACYRCHEGAQVGEFTRTDIECATCHQSDLALALNPDHLAQGWVADCDRCHIPTGWTGAAFNHATFPLTGAHSAASCTDCHVGSVFAGTSSNCFDCHQSEYDATTAPNHSSAGFSTSCQDCHSTSGWTGAGFTHSSFPLTGAHVAAACTDCHVGSVFAGTPSSCNACHQADYDATTSPNHSAAGFPLSCESCHGTSGWAGASFDHSSFPLTGAHLATDCTQCHMGGVFSGTPSSCNACHQADYDATTSPNHSAAGFPVSCESCHNTSTWNGAVFNHSFPINSGKHAGLNCMDCHMVPSNFSVFSCIDCHEHNDKNQVDDDHSEVGGYSYNSPACYNCHPNGNN